MALPALSTPSWGHTNIVCPSGAHSAGVPISGACEWPPTRACGHWPSHCGGAGWAGTSGSDKLHVGAKCLAWWPETVGPNYKLMWAHHVCFVKHFGVHPWGSKPLVLGSAMLVGLRAHPTCSVGPNSHWPMGLCWVGGPASGQMACTIKCKAPHMGLWPLA